MTRFSRPYSTNATEPKVPDSVSTMPGRLIRFDIACGQVDGTKIMFWAKPLGLVRAGGRQIGGFDLEIGSDKFCDHTAKVRRYAWG